jgi:23S rRNA (uracil1939-C5)-methyltransferase
MRAGDVTLVEPTEMATTGEAVELSGSQRLLIPGVIPGERAQVRIVGERGESLVGELVEVTSPSPYRVRPACRHAAECGGCAWQHIAYPEQLRLKKRILDRLLHEALDRRAPHVQPMAGMPVGADGMPWGFRHKAAFVFGPGAEGRGPVMGHYARGTHTVVPVEECPVHSARANRIAFALRDELVKERVPVAFVQRNGLLRHVVVRTSVDEKEAAAVLVVTDGHRMLKAPMQRLLASPECPTGLMLNLHDRPGPYLFGRETVRLDGQGHVREDRLGLTFLVSPTGFFQTNVVAAAELLRLVQAGLPPRAGLQVLDLYSGSGLFALPLARAGHVVTAVEESRKATRDAALNGRVNQIPQSRLRLTVAKVEEAVGRMKNERFDVVILDPPRQGCPPQVVRDVTLGLRPERLILVSCNPEALARELSLAIGAGYRVRLVQPVDMFPHTPHIEAVAVLERPGRPHSGHRPSGRDRGERPPEKRRAEASDRPGWQRRPQGRFRPGTGKPEPADGARRPRRQDDRAGAGASSTGPAARRGSPARSGKPVGRQRPGKRR